MLGEEHVKSIGSNSNHFDKLSLFKSLVEKTKEEKKNSKSKKKTFELDISGITVVENEREE